MTEKLSKYGQIKYKGDYYRVKICQCKTSYYQFDNITVLKNRKDLDPAQTYNVFG
jgi:hypothetical protein